MPGVCQEPEPLRLNRYQSSFCRPRQNTLIGSSRSFPQSLSVKFRDLFGEEFDCSKTWHYSFDTMLLWCYIYDTIVLNMAQFRREIA